MTRQSIISLSKLEKDSLPLQETDSAKELVMIQYPSDQKEAKVLRLLRAYQESPRPSLLEKLLRLNMGIVYEVLGEFAHLPEQEKLVQVVQTALQESFHRFDLEGEESFTEFAKHYIRQKLIDGETPLPRSKEEETNSDTIKAKTMELLELYRQSPTLRLRNHLVRLNIGLVRKEAVHWANQCQEPFEELVQVGCLGLIRAIERFDLARGHAFSSFAVPYIRGEIQHYLRDKSPAIRVPRRWQMIYTEASHHCKQLRETLQREPTAKEIAEALKIPLQEWQEIKLAFQNRVPLSLDTPMSEDEDTTASLGDMLTDSHYRNFQLAQEDSLRLQEAMNALEQRTRQILEFVFIREFTHKEAAEMLGISAVTVSRQIKKGLKLLKELLMTPID